MPGFFWKGIDSAGNSISGYRVAENVNDLKTQLLADGIALLNSRNQSNFIRKLNSLCLVKKLSAYEFAVFFEQLSVLIGGGVQLLAALQTISSQAQDFKTKKVIDLIKIEIERGNNLSVALAKASDVFDEFIVEMVRVGELGEKLPLVLTELSDYLKKNYELRRDLINSAAVPVFTLFFAILIILGIFIGVVPQFKIFFESLGKNIPSSTKKLIAISDFLQSSKAIFCVIVAVFFTIILIFIAGKVRVKKIKDYLFIRVPFFARLIVLSDLSSFLRSLNLLLKSGLPLINSVLIAKSAVNNYYLKNKISDIANGLAMGKTLAESLNCLHEFYKFEMLKSLVNVGEKAGNLNAVLDKTTDFFGNELKRMTVLVTSLFQPLLLVVIGIIVGTLIWIIYLPIINLAYSLN